MTTASLPDVLSPAARSFAAGPHRLLIGGERCDAADERSFETIDPSTGRPIAPVAYAGPEDVDRAVRAAREAFGAGPWRSMPASQRGTAMMRLADLIESHADELAELEALDNGKPVKLAKVVDVRLTVEHVRYFAGWPTKIVGETLPVTWPNAFCYTRKEPVGVCGQIIPWNFPLLMAAWKVAPALAAGCTVVLKPAEQTPLTALRFGELALEAGIPEGVLNVIAGDGEAGAKARLGPGLDESTQLGPLISAEQEERVRGYIESGKSEGAELVTGGNARRRGGDFLGPTPFNATHDKPKK